MSHSPPHPSFSKCCAREVRNIVRQNYARLALIAQPSSPIACGCCGSPLGNPQEAASMAGYTAEELQGLPPGANLGLSCGNPTALTALKPGEIVLDLGSGGGLDVFIAGRKVGPSGRAIGVDMTPEMVAKARRHIASYRSQTGLDNVEFLLGEIESLPVASASVDVVISNCVINLSPDKAQVWREIARVLKPGGRAAVSDLALLQPLPSEVLGMAAALVGCIAGAVLVSETENMIQSAGLQLVKLYRKPTYVEAMASGPSSLYQQILCYLPEGTKLSTYITSLEIEAQKPA